MSKSRRALTSALAAIFAFGIPSSVSLQAPERVRLQWKGQPGETYYLFLVAEGEDDLQDASTQTPVIQVKNSMTQLVERVIEDVTPQGRLRVRMKFESLAMSERENGQLVFFFDSRNADQLAAARKDPGLQKLADLVDAVFRYEQEPTGEMRSFQEETPQKFPTLEDSMVSDTPALIVPSAAVAVGESWSAGRNVAVLRNIGRIELEQRAILKGLSATGRERTAAIDLVLSGVFTPDADAGVSGEMTAYRGNGIVTFSIDRGRVTKFELSGGFTLNLRVGGKRLDYRRTAKVNMTAANK